MIRIVLFLLGCALMALSLLLPFVPRVPDPERWGRAWVFDAGLLLAVAAHGWPDGLR